jgi:hypothetical protein
MKDLLSASIDTLVQDSDEVKHLFEEIKHQLPEVLQIKLILPKGADWSMIRRQV